MCVADIYKSVILKMSGADYGLVLDAATARGETIELFLAQCSVREAQIAKAGQPYEFAGQSFRTNELPDTWYETFSEQVLICHLVRALRDRHVAAAYAMAIELLDFPNDWHDLERNVNGLSSLKSTGATSNETLASLVNATVGYAVVPVSANTWDCCAGLLKAACNRIEAGASAPCRATS